MLQSTVSDLATLYGISKLIPTTYPSSTLFMEIVILVLREFELRCLEHILHSFCQLPLPSFRLRQQIYKHS